MPPATGTFKAEFSVTIKPADDEGETMTPTPDDILAFYKRHSDWLIENEFGWAVVSATYQHHRKDKMEVSLELKPGVSWEDLEILLDSFVDPDDDGNFPVKDSLIIGHPLTKILSALR